MDKQLVFCEVGNSFVPSPDLFYLLTAGVEVVHFHLITRRHTHRSRQDSSGRGIGPLQRPLPDNTQTLYKTNIHAPSGIRNQDPSHRSAADLRLRCEEGIKYLNVICTIITIRTYITYTTYKFVKVIACYGLGSSKETPR
jgi:hypothetical protein